MFQLGDRVITINPVDDEDSGEVLLAGTTGTITRFMCDIVTIKTSDGEWQVGEDDIKLEERTQAQIFGAEFNFCQLVNRDIAKIEFMDGSVLEYGKDWMD